MDGPRRSFNPGHQSGRPGRGSGPREVRPQWHQHRPEMRFPNDQQAPPLQPPPFPPFGHPHNTVPEQFIRPPPNRWPSNFNDEPPVPQFTGRNLNSSYPPQPNPSQPHNFNMPPPGFNNRLPAPEMDNHSIRASTAESKPPPEQTQRPLNTAGKIEKYQSELRELLGELQRDKVASEANEDQAWVDGFIHNRKRSCNSSSNGKPTKVSRQMTVPEYRSLLRQSLHLQQELEGLHKELSEQEDTMEESSWQAKINRIREIKMSMQSLKETLTIEITLSHIQRKLRQIKGKRERKRRVRSEREEEENEKEERIQQLHEKLDQWQEQQKEKAEQLKKEKELKQIADSTLAEVRKKLSEVKKNQQTLVALEKLRDIRKQNHNKQGLYTALEVERAFEERVALMKKVLEQRVSEYEAEEKTLQVMLATEQEENEERERERREAVYEEQLTSCKKNTMEYLFGKEEAVDPGDVLYPFQQFYEGASNSLSALMSIRHGWDVHLVPGDDTDGSCVPVGWVTPSPPSSKSWASALLSSGQS